MLTATAPDVGTSTRLSIRLLGFPYAYSAVSTVPAARPVMSSRPAVTSKACHEAFHHTALKRGSPFHTRLPLSRGPVEVTGFLR